MTSSSKQTNKRKSTIFPLNLPGPDMRPTQSTRGLQQGSTACCPGQHKAWSPNSTWSPTPDQRCAWTPTTSLHRPGALCRTHAAPGPPQPPYTTCGPLQLPYTAHGDGLLAHAAPGPPQPPYTMPGPPYTKAEAYLRAHTAPGTLQPPYTAPGAFLRAHAVPEPP